MEHRLEEMVPVAIHKGYLRIPPLPEPPREVDGRIDAGKTRTKDEDFFANAIIHFRFNRPLLYAIGIAETAMIRINPIRNSFDTFPFNSPNSELENIT